MRTISAALTILAGVSLQYSITRRLDMTYDGKQTVVQEGQELVALLVRDLLHQVGGVVGREKADPRAALGRGKRAQKLRLVVRAQAEEQVLGLRPRERLKVLQAVLGDEETPRIQKVLGGEALRDVGFEIGRRHGRHRSGSVPLGATFAWRKSGFLW